MTVQQNEIYKHTPAIVPLNRIDTGKKIFEFLAHISLRHPYEGGELLISRVAFAWAFGMLFNLKRAQVFPFRMDVTDTTEFEDDDSTKYFDCDSITVFHKKYGCYLKLVSR